MPDILKRVDNVIDLYFDALADCIETKKDPQGLRGWLRVNLHEAVARVSPARQAPENRYLYHGIVALLVLSVINLLLVFFRYIVDTV